MESITAIMEHLGGELTEVHGIPTPIRFARPRRTHSAVRQGVGVTRHPWGILVVDGDDRHEFLDNTLTCRVPTEEGIVRYGFLLDPDGIIETDLYVVETGDRYLCLTAPGTAASLASELGARTFIQDVTVENVTNAHVILGVHGPAIETKLAGVMPDGTPPADELTMSRGVIREEGVTLVRLDAPTGEPGIIVICRQDDASAVFDALVSLGAMAVPFGLEIWYALCLEAGTPLFETELAGRNPNECGQLTAGVSLDKGCFVGQEVVARIANLTAPRDRLVGLLSEEPIEDGSTVQTSLGRDGLVTRSAYSQQLNTTVAMAVAPASIEHGDSVSVDGIEAQIHQLPFFETSIRSGRVPTYD